MTVGELINKLYKFNPQLPIVVPNQIFMQGSEHTGIFGVDVESTIEQVVDLETRVVLIISDER